jgi:hypothetical protein
MSEDLLVRLKVLEDDYFGQPSFLRQADLEEINQIRSQLGLPLVDAGLNAMADAVEAAVEEEPKAKPEPAPDHAEARKVYQAYLKKIEELDAHRVYAEQVVRATEGRGQTRVRPLATMGTGGGPLLCDHCGKPMVLEGEPFHGVPADAAWKRNPSDDWTSWILGGMVVEIQTNGTLRVYHGYDGRNDNQCCNVASREREKARAKFESREGPRNADMMLAFLAQEFPDRTEGERLELYYDVFNTMYVYDPGLGINRPTPSATDVSPPTG